MSVGTAGVSYDVILRFQGKLTRVELALQIFTLIFFPSLFLFTAFSVSI